MARGCDDMGAFFTDSPPIASMSKVAGATDGSADGRILLDDYLRRRSRADCGGAFWTEHCAVALYYHRWLNRGQKEDSILRRDGEHKVWSSDEVAAVELRKGGRTVAAVLLGNKDMEEVVTREGEEGFVVSFKVLIDRLKDETVDEVFIANVQGAQISIKM